MNIVMTNYLYTTLLIASLLFSCSNQKSASTFGEYMRHYWSNYREAEIVAAEKMTLQVIDKAVEYRSEGVDGLDYNWILLCSYSRLYHIHSMLGNKSASQNDLMKIRGLYESGEYSPDQIEDEIPRLLVFVKDMDVEHSVRWIKE